MKDDNKIFNQVAVTCTTEAITQQLVLHTTRENSVKTANNMLYMLSLTERVSIILVITAKRQKNTTVHQYTYSMLIFVVAARSIFLFNFYLFVLI